MNIHVLKCAMANSGNRIGPNGILYNVTALEKEPTLYW